MPSRYNERANDALRPVTLETSFINTALGSCLVSFGNTRVLCAVSIERGVPPWLRGSAQGWLTAEYAMLPQSSPSRIRRETNGVKGRTAEIQRLIGRSLRSIINLDTLGENTVQIDCDVIQADGGTRTASVCGAYVALKQALDTWVSLGNIAASPLTGQIAAVSVGIVEGEVRLDLDYAEDSVAEVDLNCVANAAGEIVEIQGTGEQICFSRAELDSMLDLALPAIAQLQELQNEALAH